MNELPVIQSLSELRMGRDPGLDAWLLHFMTENNLEYLQDPVSNASPEQVRFMVSMDEDQVYIPCADERLRELIQPKPPQSLQHAYTASWRALERLISENISDGYIRQRVFAFCRHRFDQAVASHILIPSRLMKRLTNIFLTQSGMVDPYRELKKEHNARAREFLRSKSCDQLINYCFTENKFCGRVADLRWELDRHELETLFALSTLSKIWHGGAGALSGEALKRAMLRTDGYDCITRALGPQIEGPKKILFLTEFAGGILFDLQIIRSLLRQGHSVILALKESFHFQAPVIWDTEQDPVLAEELAQAHICREHRHTKNELLRLLRENQFLVISDGTRERLNIYRTSVTFARAWKEADLIIAKGWANRRRLIETSVSFTRDILSYARDGSGTLQIEFREKPGHIVKFSEFRLKQYASKIIQAMREARAAGKSVMFYSAIVGSIPGETQTAISVLTTFVDHLRERLEGTFIINPAEHFTPGMDGDDLMYMWEMVQRSGLINVWRFQSVEDIEHSFELMGKKVPPAWSGKDSTFSTGCTKEMHIALDMQKIHPELQIIGPSPEKFFRRHEYGVGKYYEAGIEVQ